MMSDSSETETETPLICENRDGVAWLRFNRPAQLNAFTPELYRQIKDALRIAEADESVDTIVLTGTGRAFATGGDLKSVLARLTDPDPLKMWEMIDAAPFDAARDTRKMIIAAVNGVCVAAGLALTLLSDVSIAAESATFGFPEGRAGFADSHGARLMFGRVSLTKIRYLLYTAKLISATEAERIGMITEVVPDDQLFTRVDEVITELRGTSSEAKLLFKEYTNRLIPAMEWIDFRRGIETSDAIESLERFAAR
jgi:enoyl-CoA hydratase/carnithine racemase